MKHGLDIWNGETWKPLFGLDHFFSDSQKREWLTVRDFAPSSEIDETESAFHVTLEVPGVEKDAIKIEVSGDRLTVSGEKKFEQDKKKGEVHFTERAYGKFQRAFTLGSEIDSEKVEAAYQNGLLKITLPKAEKAKAKLVQIKAFEEAH